jgi:hypothetical protein
MPLKVTQGIPIRSSAPPGPDDVVLPVRYVKQQPFQNLCWAACGQMVLEYEGVAPFGRLCELTTKIFGPHCCADEDSCDNEESPETLYDAFGFSYEKLGNPMSERSVKEWIRAKYPVQTYFEYSQGGAHTALIVGFLTGGRYLVYDPRWGDGVCSYEDLLAVYGMGSWEDTWFNIVKASPQIGKTSNAEIA